MGKVIFNRGIPASGKSTSARAWVNEDPNHRIIINWDSYRNSHGPYWIPAREPIIVAESVAAVKAALNLGFDVCIDNMNLSERSTIPFLNVILEYNTEHENQYTVEYKDFKTPLEVCLERDAKRENPIGASVITSIYNKHKNFYENG